MKFMEWNIHKMTNDIPVKSFVTESILNENADIICLAEYVTDARIEQALEDEYWYKESNTESGNKILIAVKKALAVHGITVINDREEKDCYNFLHIHFSLSDGELFSVLGVRMLSPIDAKKQTPALLNYLRNIKNNFICAGDFNIYTHKMSRWFPGIQKENLVNSSTEFSYIYVNKWNHRVSGFGAIDHILHSDDIIVNAQYDWNYTKMDSHYPQIDRIEKNFSVWKIDPAFPDHAIMKADIIWKESAANFSFEPDKAESD